MTSTAIKEAVTNCFASLGVSDYKYMKSNIDNSLVVLEKTYTEMKLLILLAVVVYILWGICSAVLIVHRSRYLMKILL